MRCAVAGGGACCALFSLPHVCVAVRSMGGCRSTCRWYNESEAVIKALLAAYPDAAKAKNNVRCGRGRRVLRPLLSLLTHVVHSLSPAPSLSACAGWGPAGGHLGGVGRRTRSRRSSRYKASWLDGGRDAGGQEFSSQALCVARRGGRASSSSFRDEDVQL